MRIIDFHAHVFPEKIAVKASSAIGDFYQIPMQFDGTVSALLQQGDQCGIGTFVVHSVATAPQQVAAINDFIAAAVSGHPGRLIGFATLHPNCESIASEVDRAVSLGLRGVKIHPDFQRFLIDSPEAMAIYEAIEGRLPLLVHCGDYRYEYSKARRIAAVARRFPGLQVVCAHFGGWSEWQESAAILKDSGVLVDTSSTLYRLKPDEVRRLIDLYGVDRVLFGTDYPMWRPDEELERFARLPLTDGERALILHGNAERLFGF